MKRLGVSNPFAAAIRANPDDDLVRLVCADWYEDVGEPGRAQFVRRQVAHPSAEDAVSFGLLAKSWVDWVWPLEPLHPASPKRLPDGLSVTPFTRQGACAVRFSRGFAAEVLCDGPEDFFGLAQSLGVAVPEARIAPANVDGWLEWRIRTRGRLRTVGPPMPRSIEPFWASVREEWL